MSKKHTDNKKAEFKFFDTTNRHTHSHNECSEHEHLPGEKIHRELEFDDSEYHLEPIDDLESWEKENKLPPTIQSPSHAMRREVKRVMLVYNPFSGAQKGALIARRSEVLLGKAEVEVETHELLKRGHGEELMQSIPLKDVDVVCILGGDGTFHECINGWMRRTNEKERAVIPLAMIPGGTGNSFSLELQGGVKVKRAVQHIVRGVHCPIDLAKIEFPDKPDVQPIYSFNSIHWGLASKVNVTAEKLRWMGKAIRYTTASLLELMRGEKRRAKIVLEEANGNIIEYDEEFCLVIANNIHTAAKGMKMAPQAKLNDGLFDILLVRSSNAFTLMNFFKKTYDGTHTDLSSVEYRQVKSFSITPFKTDSDNEAIEEIIDIDGELKGSTPFKCTVVPGALRVIL